MRRFFTTALLFLAPAAWADGPADFKTFCSTCHGDAGKGDGPSAVALNPKPANFSDPAFWNATRTDAYLRDCITNGKPKDGMVAWGKTGQIKPDMIENLIAYIKTFKAAAK